MSRVLLKDKELRDAQEREQHQEDPHFREIQIPFHLYFPVPDGARGFITVENFNVIRTAIKTMDARTAQMANFLFNDNHN